MSDWNDWDDWESPIFEDKNSGGNTRGVLLGIGALVSIVGLIVIGILAITLEQDEDPELSRASIREAFEADDFGVDEHLRNQLERFFDKLMTASAAGDEDALKELFDAERYFQRVLDSGVITSMDFTERNNLKANTRNRRFQKGWDQCAIVHVDRLPDSSEFLAYVHITASESSAQYNFRCWLANTDRGWKLFDWEIIDFGMPKSVQNALLFEHSLDPRSDEFVACVKEISEAYKLHDAGDFSGAVEKLRMAESRNIHPAFNDNASIRFACAWSYLGDWRKCLEAAQRVSSPEQVPGSYSMQAAVYDNWGHIEKAVEFAQEYEAVAGIEPFVVEMLCEALEDLSRLEEAAPALRKWLRWNPENIDAMQYLGSALPVDQKHLLVEHLEHVADPVETAVSLAEHFSFKDEPEMLQQLVGFVEQSDPASPRADYLHGISERTEGNFARAASFFLKAFQAEQEETLREKYRWEYIDQMGDLERFVEAYESLDDPDKAFQSLAEWFDLDEGNTRSTRQALHELIDAHRQKHPDDPWLHYYSGALLEAERQYEAADQEFQAAAAADDEDLASMVNYERVYVLTEAGRGLEAYESLSPSPETFRQIASQYQWREQPEELRKLIETHQMKFPDDVWLNYYTGVACLLEEDFKQAEAIFDKEHRTSADERVREFSHSKLLDTIFESLGAVGAYRKQDDQEAAFRNYARELFDSEKLDELKTLIELHERRHPDDPDLLTWKVNRLWRLKDYEAIVRDFAGPLPDRRTAARSWEFEQNHDRVLRSFLRLKRFDEGIAYAESLFHEDGRAQRLLIAHLAADHLDEAREAFHLYDQSAYSRASIYADEDAGARLLEEDYRTLREEFPPPVVDSPLSQFAVLFLEEPQPLDSVGIRELLAPVTGEAAEITPLDAEPGESALLIKADGVGLVLTHGGSTYVTPDELSLFVRDLQGPQLQSVLQDHHAWISLEVVTGRRYEQNDNEQALAGKLVSNLLDEHCLGLLVENPGRIVPNSPQVKQALQSGPHESDWQELGEELWMYREQPVDSGESITTQRCRARLHRFAKAFASRTPQQEFWVQVRFSTDHVSEQHWIPVTDIEKSGFGRYRFTGTFQTDSPLFPGVKAGEPVLLTTFDVFDWKYGAGEEFVQGRKLPAE